MDKNIISMAGIKVDPSKTGGTKWPTDFGCTDQKYRGPKAGIFPGAKNNVAFHHASNRECQNDDQGDQEDKNGSKVI